MLKVTVCCLHLVTVGNYSKSWGKFCVRWMRSDKVKWIGYRLRRCSAEGETHRKKARKNLLEAAEFEFELILAVPVSADHNIAGSCDADRARARATEPSIVSE